MAGPLSGIGQGQVFLPNNTTSQAVQNNATAVSQQREERQAEENRVQPPQAQAAATQNTETDSNADVLRAQQDDLLSAVATRDPLDPSRERGSIVDLSV